MRVLLLALIALAATSAFADDPLRPDPQLTPGAVDPAVTQANIRSTICQPGYAKIARKRDAEAAVKREVFKTYGIDWSRHADFEDDHLISIELGGSPDDVKNQWPQSYRTEPWNAHAKDKLEDVLHRMVCAGQLRLDNAQFAIRTDWIAAYQKYVGAAPAK